jgi:hypothetical protein
LPVVKGKFKNRRLNTICAFESVEAFETGCKLTHYFHISLLDSPSKTRYKMAFLPSMYYLGQVQINNQSKKGTLIILDEIDKPQKKVTNLNINEDENYE